MSTFQNTGSGQEDCCGEEKKGCCNKESDDCHEERSEICAADKGESYCPGKEEKSCTDSNEHESAEQTERCCEKKANCCATRDERPVNTSEDCCTDGKKDTKKNYHCLDTTSKRSSRSTSPSCGRKRSRESFEACSTHLQKAFDQYNAYLEKGICICRTILGRLDKCCGQPLHPQSTTPGHSASPKKRSGRLSPRNDTSHRAGKIDSKISDLGKRNASVCSKTCCEADKPPTGINGRRSMSKCGEDSTTVISVGEKKQKTLSTPAQQTDIEHTAAREHVLLRVSGMTCTGCSKKVTNVLTNLDGVSSIKVTFVTGIAEFDLDPNQGSMHQIMPQIEKETGFRFSRIVTDRQTLDLLIDSDKVQGAYQQVQALGCSIEKSDKSTHRITYDPVVIGARSLIESIQGARLAPPGEDGALKDGRLRLKQMAWSTVVSLVLTIPILVLVWSKNPVSYMARSTTSLVLATLVQGIAVPEFYVGAIKSLVYSHVLEMDMLVVISITAAYGYSVVAYSLTHARYTLENREFFETSSLLITLVLLGRLVASFAKVKAVSAVSLRSLQAEKALLVDASGETTQIDARLLQFGDSFVIPAHTAVVTDGEILTGHSSVDESIVTGESVPVAKSPGDVVIAGTVNGPSTLTVRMTRLPGKNSVTDIANLVENALATKPRIQDLADKVASYFIPAVVAISLVVFIVWIVVSIKLREKNAGGAVGLAITYGIAVLAISCPCALGLAVPMVLVIAGGVAARAGVIIRQADVTEMGNKVSDVVFDKTGTITEGNLTVVHERSFANPKVSEKELTVLTRSLLNNNPHPVSLAVTTKLKDDSQPLVELENVESIPGAGAQGLWRGLEIKAGNPYWLGVEDDSDIVALADQGMTLLCVTVDSVLSSAFGLKSSIREEAPGVVAELIRRDITCHIVSGDGPKVVQDVASAVGIPVSNTASRHSPTEKQQYVRDLMSAGKVVLFCGDGTNDAVAVAQANVGVQIGSTSDVTRATADVILLGGLDGVIVLLDISKRTFRRIIFNFIWSAVYNFFAILLAAGAFVKIRIEPAYAGVGEIVSVLPVIFAGLTLLRGKSSKSAN